MSKSLIKWSVLSTMLSGSDNSIRRDKIPKKYEKEVNGLIDAIGEWEKSLTIKGNETQSKGCTAVFEYDGICVDGINYTLNKETKKFTDKDGNELK